MRVPGYIHGFVRRFWQSSNDHRGTPQAPGRVVTLITHQFWQSLTPPDVHPQPASGRTWGVAYRIKRDKVEEVKDYLDLREQNGYTVDVVPFTVAERSTAADSDASEEEEQLQQQLPPPNTVIPCVVYIGTPENEAFVGPVQTPEQLAAHILASKGPSGENKEYLYKLHDALIELSPDAHDHHIQDLVRIANQLEAKELEVKSA